VTRWPALESGPPRLPVRRLAGSRTKQARLVGGPENAQRKSAAAAKHACLPTSAAQAPRRRLPVVVKHAPNAHHARTSVDWRCPRHSRAAATRHEWQRVTVQHRYAPRHWQSRGCGVVDSEHHLVRCCTDARRLQTHVTQTRDDFQRVRVRVVGGSADLTETAFLTHGLRQAEPCPGDSIACGNQRGTCKQATDCNSIPHRRTVSAV
jgi:hypothetical protein